MILKCDLFPIFGVEFSGGRLRSCAELACQVRPIYIVESILIIPKLIIEFKSLSVLSVDSDL